MKDIYKRYIEMYINQVGEKYAVLVKSMISPPPKKHNNNSV